MLICSCGENYTCRVDVCHSWRESFSLFLSLSRGYVMREQVDEARTRARRRLHLSREIIRIQLSELTPASSRRMDCEELDLRALLTRIDELLHLEEQLDFSSLDVDQLQTLIDTYERLIPVKSSDQRCLSIALVEHCRAKVNLYRHTMREQLQRRDVSINSNNNNSSTPPVEHFTIENEHLFYTTHTRERKCEPSVSSIRATGRRRKPIVSQVSFQRGQTKSLLFVLLISRNSVSQRSNRKAAAAEWHNFVYLR
jgi:hypothetical protein